MTGSSAMSTTAMHDDANRRRLVTVALLLAVSLLAIAPVAAQAEASSSWLVSNSSRVDFLGTNRKFTTQTIATAGATAPYTWKTIGTLAVPRVPLAFGQYVDFLQNGTAQGVVTASTGAVTLALPVRLRDSAGATQTFTANLTTGTTNGSNSDGGPFCTGGSSDPSYCRGTPLAANGTFRMVAIVNVPQNGGTLGSGALLLLEIYGTMSQPCVGVVCTASDACHVAGTCDPSTGACSNPLAVNGTACNDSNACTRTDTCQSGTCTGSNPVVCAASDSCHTAGTCNTTTGACSNPVAANGATCSDGNGCTRTDTCQSGVCVGSNPVACSASDACHIAGTCDPSTGTCSNPNAANGTACNDANACTRSDTCQSGTCTGSNPVVCIAADACHVAGTCNPSSGACSSPTRPDGTSCDDANPCTMSDRCTAGACSGILLGTPAEVGATVRVARTAGGSRISWNDPPDSISFDVARGSVGRLPVGSSGGETCLARGITGATADDPEPPSLGSAYWYLVRSASSCGEGSYGSQGVRGTTSTTRTTNVCRGPCTSPADCPGSDTECATRTCNAGVCGFTYTASGTPLASQTSGDCRKNVCDGSGGTTTVADNTDLPIDTDACTSDVCLNGAPSHPPAPAGTRCTQSGGVVCNGSGSCVQCIAASDCAGTDTECRVRACGTTTPNTCGFAYVASGTATATQTAGDCKKTVCDGAGNTATTIDNGDIPNDGNACTNDLCTNGVASHTNVTAGTGCPLGSGSGVCNAGTCAPCGGTVQRCCPTYPACRPGLTCVSGFCR